MLFSTGGFTIFGGLILGTLTAVWYARRNRAPIPLALDCAGRPGEAVDKMLQASALEPGAHVYSQLGMEYAKMHKYPEALEALAKAIQIDPNFMGGLLYVYRGNVHNLQGNNTQAVEEYRHALTIDPQNQAARDALTRLGQ